MKKLSGRSCFFYYLMILTVKILLYLNKLASVYGMYIYKASVCQVDFNASYVELYRNVSLATCKRICQQVEEENCNGIFWNRLAGSCWLTSITGDYESDSDCNLIRSQIVFFRRLRQPCLLFSCILHYLYCHDIYDI